MSDNFDRAFEYTLRNEGGYANHKADSGGPTKYGITLKTLSRWRNAVCVENDVMDLTRDEAKAIYKAWYWDPLSLDAAEKLVVATTLFDAAVLFGVRTAAMRAQKVLVIAGKRLTIDGLVGPKTLAALNALDQSTFVIGFQSELRQRVHEIIRNQPKNEIFRDGWHNRIDRFTSLIA
jgi:type VI secretion system secreted protein VgrG